MRLTTAIVPVALAAGCMMGTTDKFETLPSAEKSLYRRCEPRVRETYCADYGEDSFGLCQAQARGKFAERPTPKQRREWLVGYGCPRDMVEANVGTSGGAAEPVDEGGEAHPGDVGGAL